jgi:hypothetical protein
MDLERFLPPWAERRIRKDEDGYLVPLAQLMTRDGRRHGNAVLAKVEHLTEWVCTAVTDMGNVLVFNRAELEEGFHPPVFVMREDAVGERLGTEPVAPVAAVPEVLTVASALDLVPMAEDPCERKMFDDTVLEHGSIAAAISWQLRIMARSHPQGSFAQQLAVMANEVAKMPYDASPNPPAAVAAVLAATPTHEALAYKVGNELFPYHPQASHVNPDYRDGWNACFKAMLAASPTPPVQPDARAEMAQKWCWWLGDAESFHIADTESDAHGEAQCLIDDECMPGEAHCYSVARVQHPIDSRGLTWLAEHVAESIEENACCWCDENTGAEEPSITLDDEDRKALGVMVAGFLREKVGVHWWTADQKTVTTHTYVAGSNDAPALTAAQAEGGR